MKKVFLLIVMAALFVSTGFAQRATTMKEAAKISAKTTQLTGLEDLDFIPAKHKTMIDVDEYNLGQSTYDWQTNSGTRGHCVAWEDGFMNAVFTQASDEAFSDRGTGMATYDPTTGVWTESAGRVENVRTGFGAIARYGENGVVIASHGSEGLIIYTTTDRTGNGDWVEHSIPSATAPMWASVATSGPDRNIIHVLGATQSEWEGQNQACLYFRSQDGGETWDIQDRIIDQISASHSLSSTANGYCFLETTESNRISFTYACSFSHGMVLYSDDNGDTWESITFFNHLNPLAELGETKMWDVRAAAGAWDANNKFHMAYELNGSSGTPAESQYFPYQGGIAYWNQDMPALDTTMITAIRESAWYYQEDPSIPGAEADKLIGYLVPLDPETGDAIEPPYDMNTSFDFVIAEGCHGLYNTGIVAMPTMTLDKATGHMYVTFIALGEGCYSEEDAVHYYRVYGTSSSNGGATWTPIRILTKGFMHQYSECVYPAAADKLYNGKVRIIYQQDGQPGSFVQNNTPNDPDATDNYYSVLEIPVEDFVSVPENGQFVEKIEMDIYPNPVKDYAIISLEREAEVVIYNAIGQSVKSFNHKGGIVNVDLSNLETGVYFVTANCGSAVNTQKIVVTR